MELRSIIGILFLFCAVHGQPSLHQQSLHKKSPYGIISNTIPKCGTHLMYKFLILATGRKFVGIPWQQGPLPFSLKELVNTNYFFQSHSWPRRDILEIFSRPEIRLLMMIRDPRDLIISLVYFLQKIRPDCKDLSFDELFVRLLQDTTLPEHYTNFLTDEYGVLSLAARYKIFMDNFSKLPNALVIKFEDFVGAKGGGSDEQQYEVILQIAAHLGIQLRHAEITYIQNNLFGGTATFRQGQIGEWKKQFTLEHKEIFKTYFPTEFLIDLGYETSYDW